MRRTSLIQTGPSTDRPLRAVDGLLPYLLARASHLISKRFYAHLRREGVPVREWRVLATLSDGDAIPLGELAEIILVEQSSTTRLVNRMIDRGLVKKAPDPADGRRVLVAITPAGANRVADLMRQAARIDRDIITGFEAAMTPGRGAALKAELSALIALYERLDSEDG
jgi:DNA-binding MarR family transcriptional regulator